MLRKEVRNLDSNDFEAILNKYELELSERKLGKAKLARLETIVEVRRRLRAAVSEVNEKRDEKKDESPS